MPAWGRGHKWSSNISHILDSNYVVSTSSILIERFSSNVHPIKVLSEPMAKGQGYTWRSKIDLEKNNVLKV